MHPISSYQHLNKRDFKLFLLLQLLLAVYVFSFMEVQDGEEEYIPSYSGLLMASADLWVMEGKVL